MPLSEFYRTSKGKIEGSQQKNSTGLAVVPNNGLVELVCENGHVMMQDQSNSRKIPKIPTSNNLLFQTPRFLDKDIVDQTAYKVGKYGTVNSIYSDVTMSAPSGETGLNQEDDMANWFNYPVDDTLQQDYCSDFLPELSGVTVNESPIQNSFASNEKRDCYNQVVRDSNNSSVINNDLSSGQGSASKLPSSRYAPLDPWSLQGQTYVSSVGSKVSDIMSTNTNNIQHNVSGNLISSEATAEHFSQMNMQKQDSVLPRTSSSLLNFSHFSRPAAIARATIQNASAVSASVSSSADRIVENDKILPASCRNPAETTQCDPSCVLRKETNYHTQPNLMPTKVDLKRVQIISPEDRLPGGKSDAVSREDASNNDSSPNRDRGGNVAAKGVPENEKAAEPVGASSSVCSGNSVERASNDPRINLKRKNCRDTEESESQSEDVEEESVGVKKAAAARGGSGSKRSRAAEVHNLSERRRRDRINEKMRALQELIPNCNKVDKASMLDEAIEYLKTLQLQVQILSMGAGLYMPPMMLPHGMQHIHAAHLPHFSPMGVGMGMGMGMGMGFGMNMLDMNAGSRGCSMIPVSPMQGAHFPSPPMSRSPGFLGMPGANLQVFGHPSQGIPLSVAGGPMAPVSGLPPMNSAIGMNALKMGVNMEASNAVPAPNADPKNLTHNTNLRDMNSADTSISLKHQSSQFHATNQEFDQSDLVPKIDQGPDVGGSGDDNSKKNGTLPRT